LLLDAALCEPVRAGAAWRCWRADHSPGEADRAALRLLPLVWWNLGGPEARESQLDELAPFFHQSWLDLQRHVGSAVHAIEELRREGIQVALLKGLALALDVYERGALRPMADVDLLVYPGERDRTAATLESLGYRAGRHFRSDAAARTHSVGYRRSDGAAIDLHWYALQECCYPAADELLWRHATRESLGDTEVLVPGPASSLIVVCCHGLRWNPEPTLRWVTDAVMVLRRQGSSMRWNEFVEEARARRVTLLIAAALGWLRREFEAPVPSSVVGELMDSNADWKERLELWGCRKAPSPATALAVRIGAHSRCVHGGVDRPGLRGFFGYLRAAWDLDPERCLAGALLARGAAKVGRRVP